MFEQVFVEGKTKTTWTVLTAFIAQTALMIIAVILPMIYFDVLQIGIGALYVRASIRRRQDQDDLDGTDRIHCADRLNDHRRHLADDLFRCPTDRNRSFVCSSKYSSKARPRRPGRY